MNTTLRNKLLVGTALVATGVFSYSEANAQTVQVATETNLSSLAAPDYKVDPIIKLNAGAKLTVDINLNDNDNTGVIDNDTFLLNANDVQLTINSGKTVEITVGNGNVIKANNFDGATIIINGSVKANAIADGAIDLSALTGTKFGTITINGGTGTNDGKIKGLITGGLGADILNLNATNGNVEINGAISLGGGTDTINVTGVATKTITLLDAVTGVEQVNVGANAKLDVKANYTSTNTKLGAGSVFITGAASTITSDIKGEAAGNGTLQIDADTTLVGNVGSTTAINKIIVGNNIDLLVDAQTLANNATIKTTNGIHLNGVANDATLKIDASSKTVTIDSIVTTQTNGKGIIKITDGDAATTIFKASVGASGKALGLFEIADFAGNSNAKVYGDLWVDQISIGTDDVLEFLGTTQAVSGKIDGTVANKGIITVGNGTAATNVTFVGAVGTTKTLDAANVLKASSATFNNNVDVAGDFINNGTVTVAQGKTLTAGLFKAGDAVGTYNITIGTTTGGVDNSATLASTAAIDYNLLNGTTANGAKLNLTQGTGVIADNQAFKIIDGTGAVTNLGTTLVKVDNTFALFDFKVRTGDGTLLAGTNNSDVIAIATHNATAGGVINVSANQSTANAILGITAAQYDAADAKFKSLYDTVTRASTANINNALEAVRPELHMAGVAAATSVTTQTTSLANTQLASLRDGSESGMYAGSASGGLRAWLQGFGQTADQSDRKGIAGYDADSYGVAVGFDTSDLAQNWVLGLMFAYGNSDIDSKSVNRTTTDIDSYQIGVYSSYNFDSATYLTGQFGYIWMNNEQTRRNVLPGIDAKGDFDSYSVYARLEAGRGYNVGGDAVVTPKFLVNYQHYNADSYRETLAGGAGLNVSADSINIFELGVGADVKWNLQQADGAVFQPKFSAGVRHDLIGDEFKTTNSFIGVPAASFTTRGADPAQTTYNLGAALTYFSAANWELSAAYDYEARSDFNSHTGSLKASFKF